MKTLYLIRHAKPQYPGGERICLGRKMDVPLCEEGFAQARLLGELFSAVPLEAVFASPMLRARQTAAPIAGGRPIVTLPDLTELDGGAWDGMPFSEIYARYPEHFIPGSGISCPPGGETDEQGLARIRAALEQAAQATDRCAAIVAHSGVNRLLLCDLLGQPLTEKKRIPQGYAAISALHWENGVWRVGELGVAPEDWKAGN